MKRTTILAIVAAAVAVALLDAATVASTRVDIALQQRVGAGAQQRGQARARQRLEDKAEDRVGVNDEDKAEERVGVNVEDKAEERVGVNAEDKAANKAGNKAEEKDKGKEESDLQPMPLSKWEVQTLNQLPTINNSIPDEWGCCRLCMTKRSRIPKRRKEFRPEDPSHRVNCCPLCPWPPKKHRKLGPFIHYYMKSEPSARDAYEKDLDTFGTHPDPPAEQQQQQGNDGGNTDGEGAGDESAAGETTTEFLERKAAVKHGRKHAAPKGKGKAKGPSREKADPYAKLRKANFDMTYYNNYVYGSPGKNTDGPPAKDLPPCCSTCQESSLKKKGYTPGDDSGCCVICAYGYNGGDGPHGIPRRQQAKYN